MSTAQSTDTIPLVSEEKLLASAIPQDHAYRKLNRLLNFDEIAKALQKTYSHLGQPGIPAVRGLKARLLQFWEDYPDRETEAAVRENLAIGWFVEFSLTEENPGPFILWQVQKKDRDGAFGGYL